MARNDLTPAMRQYKEIKKDHPDAFLFFRMGDFYEMFYEDAVEGAKVLDIALTSRGKGRNGEPIPLCGVPYHALEVYLAKMVRAGKKVALCEQVEDPKKAKGIVKRAVVRVVTPGTAIEESILTSPYPNYIASIFSQERQIGFACADLSTGEFQVTEFDGDFSVIALEEMISQFSPRELVVPLTQQPEMERTDSLREILLTPVEDWAFGFDYAENEIKKQFGVSGLEGFGLEGEQFAVSAAGALIHYLRETQKQELGHIRTVKKLSRSDYLIIDNTSRTNLELVKALHGDTRSGSLLSVMDKTITGMGKRMLRSWLLRPLKAKNAINKRLDAVEELTQSTIPRAKLRAALKGISDLERLIGRITLRSGGPRDLVALRNSIEHLPKINEVLSDFSNSLFKEIEESMDLLSDVGELIRKSITDYPPATLRDGGMIREGYSDELDELREISQKGKQYIAGIETQERERTGISNLKVKYNKVFGYYIEISKSHLNKAPSDYIRKQTLVNAERFITPELKEYEAKVLGADEKIKDLEFEYFVQIRSEVSSQGFRIQETAIRLAVVDVIGSLAELAVDSNYVRPEISNEKLIHIKDGRHPVVERLNLDESFIPNDCLINDDRRILIITGPNMGGKSTYLRQVALIVIMAHLGSFVPARSAKIGLTDRVFTRVGASDSLTQGRSTFLVEMQETGDILNNATEQSLVILDEVGRGTSTFDGLSLAWAVVEYLASVKQVMARILFATHYHELTELEQIYPCVKNLNLSVKEWRDQVIFLRKVVEGGSDKSYGIQVARLAGVPPAVIERAKEVLATLESKEYDDNGRPVLGKGGGMGLNRFEPTQKSLFSSHFEEPLVSELKKLDLNKITPIEALTILEKIQRRLKK